MKKTMRLLKNNTSGFTFVELLVVIVIMAVLIAATANFLFSQGGVKARDAERKNDLKQVAALIEQFVSSYGEPPNPSPRNRELNTVAFISDCKSVTTYKDLMKCFKQLKYVEGDGVVNLTLDPKEGIKYDGGSDHYYLYGADNNGWKVCALLENQTDPDLNGNYTGGPLGTTAEGSRTYCVVASNRTLATVTPSATSGGAAPTGLLP